MTDEEDKNNKISAENPENIDKVLSGEMEPADPHGPGRPRKKAGRPKGTKNPPDAKKVGPKPYEPTDIERQTVLMHCTLGTPKAAIARLIGIHQRTLEKHFKEEMQLGKSKSNASVASKLYEKAMKGDTQAQIFWLKSQAGWREKQDVNFSSEDQTANPVNKVQIEVIGDGQEKEEEQEQPKDLPNNVSKLR